MQYIPLIENIPGIILGYLIFLNIYRQKFSGLEIIISALLPYAAYLLNPILGNIVFTVSLAILANRKTANSLLSGYYAILSITILIIGSTMADVIMEYALHRTLLISSVLLLLICYPLSRFIGGRLHKTYIQLSSDIKQKFAMYGFTISAWIFMLAHANMFMYRIVEDQRLLFAVVILIFFVAVTMTAAYSLTQQKQAEAILRGEAEKDLIDHTKQLEIEYNDLRSFRHDYRNLLSSLMGYDNIDELKKHLAKSLAYADESLKNLDSVMSRLSRVNIPELKGLLAMKFAHAQALGIDVQLNIAEPIYDIALNRLDLCRLAGIMVDNAIEELENSDDKTLKLAIVIDGEETLIICSNPCKSPPPINKLFGYSGKGVGRGLGLINLKNICDENRNTSYTVSTENGEFTLVLSIMK